jgi:hypothetical protein
VRRVFLIVFALALAVNLVSASRVAILDRDGVEYLACAQDFARGDMAAGLAHHYPPLYPVLVAGTERLGAGPETAGLLVSAVVGALGAALGAMLVSHRGVRAALVAGIVLALNPANVELGAAVLADACFVTLILGALVAASRRRWVLAGTLAALSYLARPEGLVVLLVLAVRARTRAVLVLAPVLVVAIPYIIAIKKDPSMTGGEAGVWKLTKKRELFLEAGGERVFPRALDGRRHLSLEGAGAVLGESVTRLVTIGKGGQLYWVGFALKELLAVLLVLLVVRRVPPRGLPELDLALVLLLVYSLVRVDERYGTFAATLLLPWLGAWLADLARPKWLLAAAFLVLLFPATRVRHTAKVTWREAGIMCRGLDCIASTDRRVAFYANARFIDLNVVGVDEARRQGARAIVVRADSPLASSPGSTRIEGGLVSETVVIVPVREP